MRAVLIGLSGVAASLVAWALSRSVVGFPGATLFVLAILIAPVAVGFSIGIALWPALLRSEAAGEGRGSWISSRLQSRSQSQCHECGTDRALHRDIWVCATCDRIAVLDAG